MFRRKIPPLPPGCLVSAISTVSANNNWLASLRGRLGWALGSWMPYVTGGAAWTKTSYTARFGQTAVVIPPHGAYELSFGDTKTGFTVGGGLDMFALVLQV
jgi:opacity protein-like surface antigen